LFVPSASSFASMSKRKAASKLAGSGKKRQKIITLTILPPDVLRDVLFPLAWETCLARTCTQMRDAGRMVHEYFFPLCKMTGGLRHYIESQKRLKHLDFSYCRGVKDEDLARIVGACPQITNFDLQGCQEITDAGLRQIAGLTGLTSLTLTDCKWVTDSALALIGEMSQLVCLHLSSCQRVTVAGLIHVAGLTGLTSLGLRNCKWVTDIALGLIGKMSQLEFLDLSFCDQITDEELRYIAQLSQLRSLHLLYCTGITDTGLVHIARLSQLETLDLRCCDGITEFGRLHLKCRLNSCLIIATRLPTKGCATSLKH